MNKNTKRVLTRRHFIQIGAVGGASAMEMPRQWSKPVVNSVILPSHALTTATGGDEGAGTTTPDPMACQVGTNSIPFGVSGVQAQFNGQLKMLETNVLSARVVSARNDTDAIGVTVRYSVVQNGVEFVSDQSLFGAGSFDCSACETILGQSYAVYHSTSSGPTYESNSMDVITLGPAVFIARWSDGVECQTAVTIVERDFGSTD